MHLETFLHIRHIAHIPSRDVIVKGCLVLEGIGHIRHASYIPVADMAIGGEGRGFVGAPQVDRGLEVCIGKDRRSGNVSRPVVRPVWIGRKG